MEGPGFSFFCRCSEGTFFFNNLNNLMFQFKYLDKLNFKGWTGRLCDEDIDECVTSPCKNGGLCINIPASYTCACLFGKL